MRDRGNTKAMHRKAMEFYVVIYFEEYLTLFPRKSVKDWLSVLDSAMGEIFLTVWMGFLRIIYHSFSPYVAAV